MPDETLPQAFNISCAAAASELHDAWLARAERLLCGFEQSRRRSQSPASPLPSLGFIVLASDYLWGRLGDAADFSRLEVRGFAAHCRALLAAPDSRIAFADTLVAFYDFLADSGMTERTVTHAITRELRDLTTSRVAPSPP
jgi:hypothetical protein